MLNPLLEGEILCHINKQTKLFAWVNKKILVSHWLDFLSCPLDPERRGKSC